MCPEGHLRLWKMSQFHVSFSGGNGQGKATKVGSKLLQAVVSKQVYTCAKMETPFEASQAAERAGTSA